MGRVKAINISKEKGTVKQSVDVGYFIVDFGLEGDAHAGKWHRQVSLLGQESVDIMIAQGAKGLCSGKFAENITTEGIILHELPIGTLLKIGETVQEVSQIGKECHHGCEIQQQIGSCIMPTPGIFTKVIKGGSVYPGDEIKIVEAVE